MPETGPHLIIATFCKTVLEETNGVLSLIRIVDRFTQTATGPEPPAQMPPFIIDDVQLVLTLKPDRARGRFAIKIVAEDPAGIRTLVGESDVNLQPGNQGVNLVINANLAVQHAGVYWFDVVLGSPESEADDVLMTRVPLEVVYQRLRGGASPADRP